MIPCQLRIRLLHRRLHVLSKRMSKRVLASVIASNSRPVYAKLSFMEDWYCLRPLRDSTQIVANLRESRTVGLELPLVHWATDEMKHANCRID